MKYFKKLKCNFLALLARGGGILHFSLYAITLTI